LKKKRERERERNERNETGIVEVGRDNDGNTEERGGMTTI
jgi:hypothetical protein